MSIDWSNSVVIILLFATFSHHRLMLMAFHLSLSGSKSTQASRTLLSILDDLNNSLIWMLSVRSTISNSSSSSTDLSFRFPCFLFCGPPGQQCPRQIFFFVIIVIIIISSSSIILLALLLMTLFLLSKPRKISTEWLN